MKDSSADKRQELISIIMAAFNAEKTIDHAIQSVLKQTYEDWELIVIDDCSSDNTSDIISAIGDPRIHLLRNDTNTGVSKAREKGMHAAKGEWIAVLDSDDAWVPEKLEKQINLAKSCNAELIFTGSSFMDDSGSLLNWQLHVPATVSYRSLLKQNIISNSSVLVKTRLYRKHYAVGDRMHEDFAMWLSILKEGITGYGIDEPLLIYRLSGSSKSGNKLKAAVMNWNTYRYTGLNPLVSLYYMCWYSVNGIIKYASLKRHYPKE